MSRVWKFSYESLSKMDTIQAFAEEMKQLIYSSLKNVYIDGCNRGERVEIELEP